MTVIKAPKRTPARALGKIVPGILAAALLGGVVALPAMTMAAGRGQVGGRLLSASYPDPIDPPGG